MQKQTIKVKICGVKEKEDLVFIDRLGADYIGFVLYPKSPRYAGDKIKELLAFETKARKVAVFVNPEYEEVKKVLDLGADLIQLHGKETPEFGRKVGFSKIIKAFRIKEEINLETLLEELNLWEKAHAILFDTYKKGLPGGTGETFNWEIARKVVDAGFKIILAGGINPENVKTAIIEVKPYAIDVSSGVEEKPGKKNFKKLKKLFDLIRETERI